MESKNLNLDKTAMASLSKEGKPLRLNIINIVRYFSILIKNN